MASDSLSIADMQALIAPSPFHALFSPDVVALDHENLVLTLRVKMSERLQRQPETGQWHGGAIASVVDIAGCYALTLITGGRPPPTVNFRTDYLRPALTDLVATAKVRRAGRTAGVVDVDVVDDDDRLVAVGRGCYMMSGHFSSR